MGRACSRYGEERNAYIILVGNQKKNTELPPHQTIKTDFVTCGGNNPHDFQPF
jgi:hypothetical protein